MTLSRLNGTAAADRQEVEGLLKTAVDQERRFIEQQFDAALRACMTEDYRRQRVICERRDDYVLVKVITTFKIPTTQQTGKVRD